MRCTCAVLYCYMCPDLAVLHLSTLSHKRKIFFSFFFNSYWKKWLFWFFLTTFDRNDIGIHVKYSLFVSDFNETWIFLDSSSKKYSYNKFYENPSSGSQVVPCGRTDGQTNVTKLVVTLRNFANELINCTEKIINFKVSTMRVSRDVKIKFTEGDRNGRWINYFNIRKSKEKMHCVLNVCWERSSRPTNI